jgi:lysophospholipase L1-like esterase
LNRSDEADAENMMAGPESSSPSSSTPPRLSRRRKVVFAATSLGMALFIGGVLCEAVFRGVEAHANAQASQQGPGGMWLSDGRWGWKPSSGHFTSTTSEFSVTGTINSLNMNDVPFVPGADAARTRVFTLGDSHTYAVGVSVDQTWPKVLEKKLNANRPDVFRVYNGGVVGFNMHQYLLRLMDQGPTIQPHYVILGLSYATDLYDLLPPDHGGWIYGDNTHARDYFDLDDSGTLGQRRWAPDTLRHGVTATRNSARSVRVFLERFATFRHLRRSRLALLIGSHVRVGGQSLWPNVEVVLEKQISEQHRYQWKLFDALLDRIDQEARRQHAQLIVVGIPYLPQVYDEIWRLSFGGNPAFSRTAGIERVKAMCSKRGILYIDTLDSLRERSRQSGHWVHYHTDAHPTAEGHEVIAETIFRDGIIQPRGSAPQP